MRTKHSIISLRFLIIIASAFISLPVNAQKIYSRGIISLIGGSNSILDEINDVIPSDDDDIREALLKKTDKESIGFYLDTLSGRMYYNTYDIRNENYNTQNKTDFSGFYNAGEINYNKPIIDSSKIKVNDQSFDHFFEYKTNVESLKKGVLFSVNSTNINNFIEKHGNNQPVVFDFIDVRSKTKIGFFIQYEDDNYLQDKVSIENIRIVFYQKENSKWKQYDSLKLNDDDLEKNLDSLLIFKPANNSPPIIYLNMSTETLTGRINQNQLLIITGKKSALKRIVL